MAASERSIRVLVRTLILMAWALFGVWIVGGWVFGGLQHFRGVFLFPFLLSDWDWDWGWEGYGYHGW